MSRGVLRKRKRAIDAGEHPGDTPISKKRKFENRNHLINLLTQCSMENQNSSGSPSTQRTDRMIIDDDNDQYIESGPISNPTERFSPSRVSEPPTNQVVTPSNGSVISSISSRSFNPTFVDRRYPPTIFNPESRGDRIFDIEKYFDDSEACFFCDPTDPLQQEYEELHSSGKKRREYVLNKKSLWDEEGENEEDKTYQDKSRLYHLSEIVLKNMVDYEKILELDSCTPFCPIDKRSVSGAAERLFQGSDFAIRDLHLILSNLLTKKSVSQSALDTILAAINLLFGKVEGLNIPKTFSSLQKKNRSLTNRIKIIPFCHFCQKFIFRNLKNPICEECKGICGKKKSNGVIDWDSKIFSHPFPQLLADYIKYDDEFRSHVLSMSKNLDYLEWTDSRFGSKLRKRIQELDDFDKCLFIIFTLSADKVSLFKSGIKKSVKPYSFQIDSLPESIRFKFHYIFMFLLVPPQEDSKYQLKNPNIPMFIFLVQWYYMRKERYKKDLGFENLENLLRSTVYDTPEAAEQLMEKQHNAENGCYKCRKKGSQIPPTNPHAPPMYEFRDGPGIAKTLYHTVYSASRLGDDFKRGQKVDPSLSILFELFSKKDLFYDYLCANTTDNMHLLMIMFLVVNKTLSNPFREQSNVFIREILYLRGGGRRLRSLLSMGSWKYQERLNFLRFFFPLFVDISTCRFENKPKIQRLANLFREVIVEQKKGKKAHIEGMKKSLHEIKEILLSFPQYRQLLSHHVFFDHMVENMVETGPLFTKNAHAFESFYSIMRRVKGRTNVSESIMKIILTYYENHLTRISFPKEYSDELKMFLNRHFDFFIPKEKFKDQTIGGFYEYRLASKAGFTSKNMGLKVSDELLLNHISSLLRGVSIIEIFEFETAIHPKLKCLIDTSSNKKAKKSSNSLVLLSNIGVLLESHRDIQNLNSTIDFNSKFSVGRVKKIVEIRFRNANGVYITNSFVLFNVYHVVGLKRESKTLVVDNRLDTSKDHLVPLDCIRCHCIMVPEVRRDLVVSVHQSVNQSAEMNMYNHSLSYLVIMFGY